MTLPRFLLLTISILFISCSPKEKNYPDEQILPKDTLVTIQPEEIIEKPHEIILEKEFLYDKHTLEDVYPYKDTTRMFQWDKIKERLTLLESVQAEPAQWGILQNRKNKNGEAPLARNLKRNAYKNLEDPFGVERYQGTPFYLLDDLTTPERYGEDGMLVKILAPADSSGFIKLRSIYFEEDFMVPEKYVKLIDDSVKEFHKVIVVDRTNQNITTLEEESGKWRIRSMNPATTGLHNPPYQYETPLGIFVIQEKKSKMIYLVDGGSEVGGFAPSANRFSNGAYIHGVPVNSPRKTIIEYSSTLGTTPRSHKCVRNATSHAQFIFDWAPIEQSLVIVIE